MRQEQHRQTCQLVPRPWGESVPAVFGEARRPVWWGLRQRGSKKHGRSPRCNGEPDYVCIVGHQKDFVCLSEWDRESSEERCNWTYFKRINLAIALKVNQREQRVETKRPTIERMVPWTRGGALEMLRMAEVCIDLKGTANRTFSWIGYGWERGESKMTLRFLVCN